LSFFQSKKQQQAPLPLLVHQHRKFLQRLLLLPLSQPHSLVRHIQASCTAQLEHVSPIVIQTRLRQVCQSLMVLLAVVRIQINNGALIPQRARSRMQEMVIVWRKRQVLIWTYRMRLHVKRVVPIKRGPTTQQVKHSRTGSTAAWRSRAQTHLPLLGLVFLKILLRDSQWPFRKGETAFGRSQASFAGPVPHPQTMQA